jgi:predicted HTH domain antitoxin
MRINLDIPDEIAQCPTFSRADWLREMAISLFEQERVTLGIASQIAGLHLMEFQRIIGSRGVCAHYDVAEFTDDIANLRRRGWL